MNRIPVGETIGGAYRFAFGGFFGNLGVVWLPMGLFIFAYGYVTLPMIEQMFQHLPVKDNDTAALQQMVAAMAPFNRLLLPLWLVQLFVQAQIMLGLTRRALGLSNGASFVFLSLGPTFWRLFGSYIAVMMIIIASYIAVFIGAIVIGVVTGLAVGAGAGAAGAGQTGAGALGGLAGVAVAVAVILALIYIVVRLTFLLTAAVVDEDRFELLRGWEMAGGSVLRIIVIGIAVLVPIGILNALLLAPVEAGVFLPALSHLPVGHKADDPQAAAQLLDEILKLVRERWFVILPVYIIGTTFTYGAMAGAGAAAWRALVPSRSR